MKFLLIW